MEANGGAVLISPTPNTHLRAKKHDKVVNCKLVYGNLKKVESFFPNKLNSSLHFKIKSICAKKQS